MTAELVINGTQGDACRMRASTFDLLGYQLADAWVLRPFRRVESSAVELHLVAVAPIPPKAPTYAVILAETDMAMVEELQAAALPASVAITALALVSVGVPDDMAVRRLCRHVARLAVEDMLPFPDVWTAADRALWAHTITVLADCINVDLVSTMP